MSSFSMEWVEKDYYVYILSSAPRGALYIGMTSDLPGRVWEHRSRILDGFTRQYWIDRLVYFERHEDATVAARRERALKRWRRHWKIELIEKDNPTWRDLYSDALTRHGF